MKMAVATMTHHTYNTNGVMEGTVEHGLTGAHDAQLFVSANVTRRYAETCAAPNDSRCRHGNLVPSVPFSPIENANLSVGPGKKPRLER